MALLRNRRWSLTVVLGTVTLLLYGWTLLALPGFLENSWAARNRLWAQFLHTCECHNCK